jgi:hypothetical protein
MDRPTRISTYPFFYGSGPTAQGEVTGTLTLDYTDFFNCGSYGMPSQAHPVSGDPLFFNKASDWHLQASSVAISSGAATSFAGYYGESIDVSKDVAGIQRTNPWDLGIYNYP